MIKKASELLSDSAAPFDAACVIVKDLEDILRKLIYLKAYKDVNGKDEYYLKEQPLAWKRAKTLMGVI